jgi:hypothetical protein
LSVQPFEIDIDRVFSCGCHKIHFKKPD